MNPNNQTNGAVPQPPNTQPEEEKSVANPASTPGVDAPNNSITQAEANTPATETPIVPENTGPSMVSTADNSASPINPSSDAAPVVTPTGSTTPVAGKKSKLPLVIALIVVLLVATGAGAYFLLNKKSDSSSKPQSSNSASKSTSSSKKQSASTNTVEQIPGYVTLDKLCYTIQVPKENTAGAENSCLFLARLGADRAISLNFSYFTKYNEGLDANVAYRKDYNAKMNDSLVSEEDIKIGGIDSKKLVYKSSGAYPMQTVYFLIPTSKYKVDGAQISGFEIISSLYEKPENKAVIDKVVSTIQWK